MKRQCSILSFLFFIAFYINHIYAYPYKCDCSYAIAVGTNFGTLHGNSPATLSSTFTLSVKNGTIPIVEGSQLFAGLTLTISTNPIIDPNVANYMYIIESAGGGQFDPKDPTRQECPTGERVSNASPASPTQGIATIHKLKLTNLGNYSITMAYINTPSALLIAPSFNFEVVGKPITKQPVVAPTIDDTVDQSKRMGLSIGLTISLVFVALFLFLLSYPLNLPSLTLAAILQDDNFLSNFFFVSALISLAVTVSLTLAWATNGGQGALGFLGSPDWNLNPISYHVIFMITLVFTFQLFFYIFGPFLVKREKSIYLDIFQVFATIGAISGLYAAFIDLNPPNKGTYGDSLTTMHSWIGIAALILIFGSFIWFTLLRLSGDFGPPLVYRWMNFASWISTILPMMAIWLTVLAIGTGISDFLGQGTCLPAGQSASTDYSKVTTPVYPYIPEGCKIGNGVGIASTFAACFTFLGAAYLVPIKVKKIDRPAAIQVQTSSKSLNKSQRKLPAEYDFDEPSPMDVSASHEGTTTTIVRRGLKASLDMHGNKRNSIDRSRASDQQTTRRSQELIQGSVTKSMESVAATAHHNLTTIELRNKRPSSSRIIESSLVQKNNPRDNPLPPSAPPALQKHQSAQLKNFGSLYVDASDDEKSGDWW